MKQGQGDAEIIVCMHFKTKENRSLTASTTLEGKYFEFQCSYT